MSTSTGPQQTHPENNSQNPGDTIADLAASLLSSPKQSHHHQHTEGHSNNGSQENTSHLAARAMSHTGAWKPALDRRQSWNAQEYKHDLLKRQYLAGGEEGKGGGFSEV
jgi:hypothetical protein